MRVHIDMEGTAVNEAGLLDQAKDKARWLMEAQPRQYGRDNALSLVGADGCSVGHVWLEEPTDDGTHLASFPRPLNS